MKLYAIKNTKTGDYVTFSYEHMYGEVDNSYMHFVITMITTFSFKIMKSILIYLQMSLCLVYYSTMQNTGYLKLLK